MRDRFNDEDLIAGDSSPAISADGYIYFGVTRRGAKGGYIFAMNPDGTERWRGKIGDYWLLSSPSISEDGIIYIGSTWDGGINDDFGYLYALGEEIESEPPTSPIIEGPHYGIVGQSYNYSFTSIDPDGHNLTYIIQWGGGATTGWIGPYKSGETITLSNTWEHKSTYVMQAKAKDELGGESDWTTYQITMPKNINWFEQFLDNHPLIKLIFDFIQ